MHWFNHFLLFKYSKYSSIKHNIFLLIIDTIINQSYFGKIIDGILIPINLYINYIKFHKRWNVIVLCMMIEIAKVLREYNKFVLKKKEEKNFWDGVIFDSSQRISNYTLQWKKVRLDVPSK